MAKGIGYGLKSAGQAGKIVGDFNRLKRGQQQYGNLNNVGSSSEPQEKQNSLPSAQDLANSELAEGAKKAAEKIPGVAGKAAKVANKTGLTDKVLNKAGKKIDDVKNKVSQSEVGNLAKDKIEEVKQEQIKKIKKKILFKLLPILAPTIICIVVIIVIVSYKGGGNLMLTDNYYGENGYKTTESSSGSSSPIVNPGNPVIPTSALGLVMPITTYSRISDPFGSRINPKTHQQEFHTGIDFAVKNTPIYAVQDGVVVASKFDGGACGFGEYIYVDHNINGVYFRTIYAHLSERLVSKGDTVKRGQLMGTTGNTGCSTGPHLHFEIRINAKKAEAVNPAVYLGLNA